MRTESVVRGDRYGGPRVPVHDRRDDPPAPGRGCQYTSEQLGDHLESYGTRPSVGRTGVCWDNAWAESFNATLKNERVHRMVYPTRRKAINDIASRIEPGTQVRRVFTRRSGTGRPTRPNTIW